MLKNNISYLIRNIFPMFYAEYKESEEERKIKEEHERDKERHIQRMEELEKQTKCKIDLNNKEIEILDRQIALKKINLEKEQDKTQRLILKKDMNCCCFPFFYKKK